MTTTLTEACQLQVLACSPAAFWVLQAWHRGPDVLWGCGVAQPGILRAFKGQVVQLLRHPSACSVINELHVAANARQRRALEAEFYGRSFTLFEQARCLQLCCSQPVPLAGALHGCTIVTCTLP